MYIASFEKNQAVRIFYIIAALVVAVMIVTAKQDDFIVIGAGIFLAMVSIFPLYLWLAGKSCGLPIWPVFIVSNGITAALPMVQDSKNLADYASVEIITGALTLMGFIILGTVIWLGLTSRRTSPPKTLLMISSRHTKTYLFSFIILGLLFHLNEMGGGFIIFPGNIMQVFRGISVALSTLGIFVLAFYDGKGMLSRWQGIWLLILTVLTIFSAAADLIMATAIIPTAMLIMGYFLGSEKIPWKTLIVILVVASVLHPGKFAMREAYWGEERSSITPQMLPKFYADWFGCGLEQVGVMVGLKDPKLEEKIQSSLLERTGSLHMLLLVQKKSPVDVPFMNGLTYEPIPRLLIPRFLDDQKGLSHTGNILLSVNYGLQTLEQTASTSIAWGLIPEAYANFGYVGVALLAVALSVFYSFATNMAAGVPVTSLRFVLALLIMGAAVKADTMGVFVTSQFQAAAGVTMAAIVLMRRQSNPYAESFSQRRGGGAYG